MIYLKRKKCEKIINSLIEEYRSRYRKEANNRIGKVSADHISRGLANSTLVVNGKLTVEYNYIDKLVDFLFQSLEKDFPKFPLKACKEILISTVETEYKKLPSNANNWLREANFLQPDMIKQYGNSISKRLEETKKNIKNRCELSNEKRTLRKKNWWKDPKWIITTIIAIIGIVVGIKQYSNYTINKNTNLKSQTAGDSSPAVITTGPNSPVIVNYEKGESLHRVIPAKVLRVRTKKRVDELEDFLIKEKLTPWRFFGAGKFKVTKYDGKEIHYEGGGEFGGSPRIVFWGGFIEPFIEDGIQKTLDEVGRECQQNNLDSEPHIKDTAELLRGVISKVYSYMAETDQVLRGKGYPDKVKRVDVKDKILKMNEVLDKHVEAALALYSNNPTLDKK
jgi:ElaB/YqjD/DUF883 family membrane-anchored ribosome-binding protein